MQHFRDRKRFQRCCCGNVFVPDGRGKRVYCDDCRIENKRLSNQLNNVRRKLKKEGSLC